MNADHLSRGRVAEFFRTVYETGAWTEATVPEPMPDVGRTRTLPEGRGGLARSLAEERTISEELVTIPPWQAKYKLNPNAAKARETVAR